MASRPPLHSQLSLFVAAVVMVACAATGMLTGVFAHTLANKQSPTSPNGPVISGTAPGQSLVTETPSPTATEASATSTATNFNLSITLSSRTLATGETFTVTVVATTGGAPVAGLTCAATSASERTSRSLLNLASCRFNRRYWAGHLDADHTLGLIWHVWHRG